MKEIDIFEDVLTRPFAEFLFRIAMEGFSKGTCIVGNEGNWGKGLTREWSKVSVQHYPEVIKQHILKELAGKGIVKDNGYDIFCHIWEKLGFIPWHNDRVRSKAREAITIYLNPQWEEDWGGIFLYKEDDTPRIKGFIPTFNAAIRNSGNLSHSVSIISPDAKEPRVSIQLFSLKHLEA
jgi:Rps23 Pro-64 3,4-dihydroxylase Tpa1-like proline 4-hydroxylase